MLGRSNAFPRHPRVPLVVLCLLAGGLFAVGTADGELPPAPPDSAGGEASLGARAQALAKIAALHPIDRLKMGEAGIPDFIAGTLSTPVAGDDYAGVVRRFLELHAAAFGLDPAASEFRVAAIERDQLGMTHLRLRQYHRGIPVLHGDLRAHFSGDAVLRVLNGEVVPGLALDTMPAISAAAAESEAAAEIGTEPGAARAELVVVRFQGHDHLAWLVRGRVLAPPGRWEVFVDASTGELFHKVNRITYEALPAAGATAGPAIGIGLGVLGNEQSHIDTYFDDSVYRMEDTTRQANNDVHGHHGAMPDTSTIRTYLYSDGLPGMLMTDEDNIWGRPDQAPAVDAHVYAAMVYDFLLGHVEINGFDGGGGSLVSTVADAACQNNAYWDGTQVSYCTVSAQFNPMSGSLDIVAHEWGHAVTEHTSNLVYEKESGALNESYSDMIGARLLAARGTPSWRIGEGFNGTGFRDMANPRAFGDPDCYRCSGWIPVENCVPGELNDFCGVHTNSGVPNKMFHLLSAGGTLNGRTVTGIGIDSAFKILHRANRFYWTETSDMEDGKAGSIAAAEDLDPSGDFAAQVTLAWEAVLVGVPANQAPIADPGGPYAGEIGRLMTFDGTASHDPDGTITSYIWDFGNGGVGNGPMGYQAYAAEGTYTVTLLVIDDMQAQNTASTTVEIGPPQAVELESFALAQSGTAVVVRWKTAFEVGHAGFHLHRRETGASHFMRITGEMVPAAAAGGEYEHTDTMVESGNRYEYRLEAIDRQGTSESFALGAITVTNPVPARVALHPNRPNPFNPRTTIDFELPAPARVVVRIYDSKGRMVRLVLDALLDAGIGSVEWDGRDHAGRPLDSGVYLCQLQVGAESMTRKVVLVR